MTPILTTLAPGLLEAGSRLIDRLVPDPAEANSADPWTSRARPTFLYVIYGVILLCVMGAIIGIWWPAHVFQAAENLNRLLGAVPESLWWLFGAGYLGYTGARSFDKWRGPAR